MVDCIIYSHRCRHGDDQRSGLHIGLKVQAQHLVRPSAVSDPSLLLQIRVTRARERPEGSQPLGAYRALRRCYPRGRLSGTCPSHRLDAFPVRRDRPVGRGNDACPGAFTDRRPELPREGARVTSCGPAWMAGPHEGRVESWGTLQRPAAWRRRWTSAKTPSASPVTAAYSAGSGTAAATTLNSIIK